MAIGEVIWIGGPVIKAKGMETAKISEVVEIGDDRLIGEVVEMEGGIVSIQVYESVTGLKLGAKVYGTGEPLSATLGPGLLGKMFDGIQRPLDLLVQKTGDFIRSGVKLSPLPNQKWKFIPKVQSGEEAIPGKILGTIPETPLVQHRVLSPPYVVGTIEDIVPEGTYDLEDSIATIRQGDERKVVKLSQKWPVRIPRPYIEKIESNELLVTGIRLIDTFFPIEKGGTVCAPGGFGTGKTVLLHQIAAGATSHVVIYIGCGERGNEMTAVLQQFPQYKDPKTNRPLMERTILIANTSNMPVSAREASIYMGVAMAEYYRDMGYDILLVADSTSRWAEALREISGRLGEMPADKGYPPYLASRIASFYERAGSVVTNKQTKSVGSITICGAVSPPEGDYTEPITAHTRRFTHVFWALDAALAYSRQYPAINWLSSYSPSVATLRDWWSKNVSPDWFSYYDKALSILQRENELQDIVKLLGSESLPEMEKMTLRVSRILRDNFLHQNAYDPIDVYTPPVNQFKMLKVIVDLYVKAQEAITNNVSLETIMNLPIFSEVMNLRHDVTQLDTLEESIPAQFDQLLKNTLEREGQ